MASVTGYADGPPCVLQGPADPIVGVHAGVALLAALDHRRRTGEGQLIEIAQIEVAASVAAEPVIEYSMNGIVRMREGNRQRGYLQGVYPTVADDAWVAISVRDDTDRTRLAQTLGRPELTLDSHDDFDTAVTEWTRTRTAAEIVDVLECTRDSGRAGVDRRPDVRHRPARRPRVTTKSWNTRSRACTGTRAGRFASRLGRSTTTGRPRRRSASTTTRCCATLGSRVKRSTICVRVR